MKYLLIPLLFITFWSCKKEEKIERDKEVALYWFELAGEKAIEIYNLKQKYTCSDIPDLTVQYISERYACREYLFIHKNDLKVFEKLKNEYESRVKKSWDAGGVLVTYQACAPTDVEREIICQDNKPTIVYKR